MTKHFCKLKNFPPVFIISLYESEQRRANLFKQLDYFGISDFHFCLYKKISEYKYSITGSLLGKINPNSLGPSVSHILTNKYWTQNTRHDYTLIVEDDIDLSIISLWNFSWDNFIEFLPKDWECVQLSVMREKPERDLEFRLKNRYNHDFGCQAYLVKRNYAEKMVNRYFKSTYFDLTIPSSNILISENYYQYLELYPIVEHIVYETLGKIYSIPMFCEDLDNTQTTAQNRNIEDFRVKCKNMLFDYWKSGFLTK